MRFFNTRLILPALTGILLLSAFIGHAQWKQVINSKGEVRTVYEIPKQAPGTEVKKTTTTNSSSGSSSRPVPTTSSQPWVSSEPDRPKDTYEYTQMNDAILFDRDFNLFYKYYDNPSTPYGNTPSGGKAWLTILLMRQLKGLADTNYAFLPLLYEAHFVKGLSKNPVSLSEYDDHYDFGMNSEYAAVTRACIFLGNYGEAINRFRRSTPFGKQKKYLKKYDLDDSPSYMKVYNYIHYMTARCYAALNMPDSANKYLAIGTGYEEEWNKLVSEGAAYREGKRTYPAANLRVYIPPVKGFNPPASYVTTCISGDCANGTGHKTWSNGDRYVGEFKDGVEHGKGICYYETGESWEGEFYKGAVYGEGIYRYPDGWVYKGYMISKKAEGVGKIYNPYGILIYEGSWRDNKRNGQGKEYSADGRLLYSGNFIDDNY